MRWLKVSYMLSRTGAPILLSATLASGCGETSKARDAATDSGPETSIIILPPSQFDGGVVIPPPSDLCNCGQNNYTFTIPFPAEGAAATPGALCADVDGGFDAGLAVASGQAARVTMAWSSGSDATKTQGNIAIAAALSGKVVGIPTVAFVPTASSGNTQVTISNVRPDGLGFAFDAAWSVAPDFQCGPSDSWRFKTTLQLRCDGGGIRAVESLTNLRLCEESFSQQRTWVSSGDSCYTCATICEMAPSPMVPEQAGDDLPLGSALTVAIRSLAKVGNVLVLLAEHASGGRAYAYDWSVSTGDLETLERDVVLWRLPEGAMDQVHLAQVAVVGAHAAAVASLRCGPCLA
jgi:hypothetical protein